MSDPYVQLVVLLAGWLCVLIGLVANGLLSLFNWRSFQSTKVKQDHVKTLAQLEVKVKGCEDLIASFQSRWSKRLADERRASERISTSTTAPAQPNGTADDLSHLSPSERALFER